MATKLTPIQIAFIITGVEVFKKDIKDVITKYNELVGATQELEAKGSKSLKAFTDAATISSVAVVGSMGAITAAISTASAFMISIGAKFQEQIANVGAVTLTTGQNLEVFADHARSIAREIPLSLTNIAKAGGELVRAGLTVEEAMGGATKAVSELTLASAGELGLENAARMVAGGLLAFNLQAKDAERVANALTAAAVKSAVTFSDVDRSFRQAASVAALVGFSVEDLSALIGMLGQAFIRGSDAGTSLKQMFISMMKPSKQALVLMKQYGLSLYDANGQVTSARNLLTRLQVAFGEQAIATGKLTENERDFALATIFGSDAIRAAIVNALKGTETFDEFKASMEEVTVSGIAAAMTEGVLNKQLDLTSNIIQALSTEATQSLIPVLARIVTSFNSVLKAIKPDQIKLFGQALATVMEGGDFGALGERAQKLLGPTLTKIFVAWVDGLIQVKSAITDKLLPAFATLLGILRELVNAEGIVRIFKDMTSFFTSIATSVSIAVVMLSAFIRELSRNTIVVQLFDAALRGLTILPLVILAAAALKITSAIVGLIGPMFLVSTAVGLLATNAENIANILANVFATAVQIVNNNLDSLSLIVVIAGAAFAVTLVPSIYRAVSAGIALIANIARQIVSFGILFVQLVLISIAEQRAALQAFNLASFMGRLSSAVISAVTNLVAATWWNIRLAAAVAITTLRMLIMRAAAFANAAGLAAMNLTMAILNRSVLTNIKTFAIWAASLIGSIIRVAAMFVATLIPAVLSAIASFIAMAAPILIIIGVLGALVLATQAFGWNWQQIFEDAKRIAQQILGYIGNKITDFFNWLKSLPIVGDWIKGIGEGFQTFSTQVGSSFESVKKTLGDMLGAAQQGLPKLAELLGLTMPSMEDFDSWIKKIEADYKSGTDAGDDYDAMIKRIKESLAGGVEEPGWFTPPDTGKEMTKAEKVRAYLIAFTQLLGRIPGMTQKALEFFAELTAEAPERFTEIAAAVISVRKELAELVKMQQRSLELAKQLAEVEKQIADIERSIRINELQQTQIQLSYESQLLSLKLQQAQVDSRMAVLRQRASIIDHDVAIAQRENLDVAEQIARVNLELLPYKQAIANIEREISDIVNERLKLELREQELLQEQTKTSLEMQLKGVQSALDKAWSAQDVAEILRLEEVKAGLEEQSKAIEQNIDQINFKQKQQSISEELAKIALEKEKLAIEELAEPYEDQLFRINQLKEADKLRSELVLIGLERQSRAIEDQLWPLEQQRAAIESVTDSIDLQIQASLLGLQQEKVNLQQKLTSEQLIQEAIKKTKEEHDTAFADMVLNFVKLILQSGAFTEEEAIETSKRLGFWNETIEKMVETSLQMDNVRKAADSIAESINNIPATKTVDIYINTHYNEPAKIEPVVNPSAIPGHNFPMQSGGITPGSHNQPMLVTAHGGEIFLGTERHIPYDVLSATYRRLAQVGAAPVQAVTNNYNVNAVYEKQQDPITVSMDLRALIGASQR